MKRDKFSVRAALAVFGSLGALALPGASDAASFKLNGVTTCNTIDGGMSMDPAGNVNVSCTVTTSTPATPTAPTQAPLCTIGVSAATITAGQSSTLTANCTPAATTYAWTSSVGAPAIGNVQMATQTFPTPGTYSYNVTGSNGAGTPAASATVSVVVNTATAAPSPTTGCSSSAVYDSYTGNQWRTLNIDRGGSVALALPPGHPTYQVVEIRTIQSTANPQTDLTAELAISPCPNDFNVPAECKTWGTIWGSATQMVATTRPTQYPGVCTIITGQQYYVNVRNTRFDRVTPACNAASCLMLLQYNSYFPF